MRVSPGITRVPVPTGLAAGQKPLGLILLGGTDALSGCGALPSIGQTSQYGEPPSLYPLPALPFRDTCLVLLFKEILKTADWAPVSYCYSFHWKPNKHLMCYFHTHSTRVGQSVLCLLYLKLVVCLHLHEEQLYQPFANEMKLAFCECVAPLQPSVALPLMRYLPFWNIQCGQ